MSWKTTFAFLFAAAMLASGCVDRKHVHDASVPGEAGPGPDISIGVTSDGPALGAEVPADGAAGKLDTERSAEVGVDLPVAPDLRPDVTPDLPQGPETTPDVPADVPPPLDVGPDATLVPDAPADAPPDLVVDLPWGPEATPDVPPTGCVIGGTPYANGTPNPANPCQVCRVASAPSNWSNVDEGTTCSVGFCNLGTCKAGCFIQGAFYAANAPNPSNACQACQTSAPTSWTALAPGSSCGTGMVCSGGTCQTGCWIQGGFVGSGATSASNTCQICTPSKTTQGWSNNDGATAVPCGGCGGTAICVNMALGTCSKDVSTFYRDQDGDGYGESTVSVQACSAPSGWSSQGGDCNDTDGTLYPGKTICMPSSDTTLGTCGSDGNYVVSECTYGCRNRQCRSLDTVDVAGIVSCGSTQCPAAQGCAFGVVPICAPTGATTYAYCDGPSDCAVGQVCCRRDYTTTQQQECRAGTSCPSSDMYTDYWLLCSPSGASCPGGTTCQVASGPLSGYVCR